MSTFYSLFILGIIVKYWPIYLGMIVLVAGIILFRKHRRKAHERFIETVTPENPRVYVTGKSATHYHLDRDCRRIHDMEIYRATLLYAREKKMLPCSVCARGRRTILFPA